MNNKPISWKDLGYNDHMEKPARTDDAQAKRQREFEDDLRKQQKHQAEMQALKQPPTPKNKLIFYPKDGKVFYNSNEQITFAPGTNPYLLISFLSTKPGVLFTAQEVAEVLNVPRSGGQDSTPDRRVRDTIKTIRKGLGLSDNDDIFIVSKGFGFNCDIEIKK